MVFLGWNSFIAQDFERLKQYVSNGGSLMLTKAHLNTNLHHRAPITLPQGNAFVDELLAKAAEAAVSPVVIPIGKGKVILFDSDKYPGSQELHDAYEKEMRKLGDAAVAEERKKGWLGQSAIVQFTVWDNGRNADIERTVFMYKFARGDTPVKLLLGEAEYDIVPPEHVLAAIYISEGVAAYPSDPLSSVLKIDKSGNEVTLTVQAVNAGTINVYLNRAGTEPVSIAVSETGIHKLKVSFK